MQRKEVAIARDNLDSFNLLFFKDGKKIGSQTFDNHWHMDYWLDTNCCSNNNATLWIWTLHQQNLSNDSYVIVQNLFSAELWDLRNEVRSIISKAICHSNWNSKRNSLRTLGILRELLEFFRELLDFLKRSL